jgi:LPS export ABC transporter protein LptC
VTRTGSRRISVLLGVLGALLLAWQLFSGNDEDGFEQVAARDERGYYLDAATLTEMSPEGRPKVVIKARLIEQLRGDDSIAMHDLAIDYATEGAGPWTMTAKRGRMPADRNSVLLAGDVTLRGRDGAVVRTDELNYDTIENLVSTAEAVTIEFGTHRLAARGLRADLNAGSLQLESAIHGQFNP